MRTLTLSHSPPRLHSDFFWSSALAAALDDVFSAAAAAGAAGAAAGAARGGSLLLLLLLCPFCCCGGLLLLLSLPSLLSLLCLSGTASTSMYRTGGGDAGLLAIAAAFVFPSAATTYFSYLCYSALPVCTAALTRFPLLVNASRAEGLDVWCCGSRCAGLSDAVLTAAQILLL